MANLSDGNGGLDATMLVQPSGGYGYNYGGYPMAVPFYGGNYGGFGGNGGFFGGDFGALIAIFFFAMMFGGFGGGWGMGGFGGGFEFPWLLASNANNMNATQDGFNNAAISSQLQGIQSGMTSGFSDVQLGIAGVNQNICQSTGQIQNALCQGFAGTTAAVTGAQNALAQQMYNGEINSLNRSFAEQTANAQGFNNMQSQLAKCCCDNQLATVQTQNIVQVEAAANRAASAADAQKIMDKLCQLEIDGVRNELAASQRENAALQNQLNMAAFRADNVAQTAQLLSDNARQTQDIENYVRPQINPAYVVPNPYAYNFLPQNGWNGSNCCNGNFQ